MSVRVKICGLANEEDVHATVALGPDFLGFIFWPGSKRAVSAEDVAAWTRDLPKAMLKVGVFVDASADEVNRCCLQAGLDIAQLHGSESAACIDAVDRPCWKVVHVDKIEPSDASVLPVDTLLIDSYTAEMPGGTGQTADWNRAADFVGAVDQNVVLAGGLTPDNIGEAVRKVSPWGVDVSSGVEQMPGKKDMQKVKEFIKVSRSI